MQPTVKRMTATTERMQTSVEKIKRETDALTMTQQKLQQDINYKKDAVQHVVDECKAVPKLLQQTWRSGEADVPTHSPQTLEVERVVFKFMDKINKKNVHRERG